MNNYRQQAQKIKAFYEKQPEEAAELSGWQQRTTKLNAQSWLEIVVLGWHKNAEASLQELACWADEIGIEVTRQGLDARINERGVMYMYLLVQAALANLTSVPCLPDTVLSHWDHVYLIDSTQVSLPAAMRTWFPGCEKDNAKLKTHLCFDYLSGQGAVVEMVAGRSPDQKSLLPRHMAQARDLVLFDLGYFSLAQLVGVAAQDAFFITPRQSQVLLYDRATHQRFQLTTLLKKRRKKLDRWVMLGAEEQLPVRIIAQRRSPQQAEHCRQEALRKACEKGQHLSPDYLIRLGWDILVTNIPDLPAPTLSALYGLRWQIEMVFKLWKSHLKVEALGQWRPARGLCQWLALRLGAILFHWIIAPWRLGDDYELSPARAYALLQTRYRLLIEACRLTLDHLADWFATTHAKLRRLASWDKHLKKPSTLQRLLTLQAT